MLQNKWKFRCENREYENANKIVHTYIVTAQYGTFIHMCRLKSQQELKPMLRVNKVPELDANLFHREHLNCCSR